MKKVLLCVLFFAFLLSSCAFKPDENICGLSKDIKLPEYKKVEEYCEGIFDYTDYYKFYYEKGDEECFEKNYYFSKVAFESNYDYIEPFVDEFETWVMMTDYSESYDFKKSQIKLGDYYCIKYKMNDGGAIKI